MEGNGCNSGRVSRRYATEGGEILKKKEDIRQRRTRKLIRQALLELTAEVGYEDVTVTALAERAMINRATFYRYYEDKEDLLFRGLDEFFDSFVASASPPAGSPPEALISSLDHIRENKGFYKVMLGPRGPAAFQHRIWRYHLEVIGGRFQRVFAGRPNTTEVDDDLVKGFAAGALGGVIRVWVDSGCVGKPEQVAGNLITMITHGLGSPIQGNITFAPEDKSE